MLPTSEEQSEVTNSRQDAESAVFGGAPGAVEDAVELVHITKEDDDWVLGGEVGLEKAEKGGVKRRLHDLQQS